MCNISLAILESDTHCFWEGCEKFNGTYMLLMHTSVVGDKDQSYLNN